MKTLLYKPIYLLTRGVLKWLASKDPAESLRVADRFERVKDYPSAHQMYAVAHSMSPCEQSYLGLARTSLDLGTPERVANLFTTDDTRWQPIAEAWFLLGLSQLDTAPELSIVAFREALCRNITKVKYVICLAESYLRNDQPGIGVDVLRRYLQEHDEDARLLARMAGLQLHTGEYASARTNIQRALQLDPKCSEAAETLKELEKLERTNEGGTAGATDH